MPIQSYKDLSVWRKSMALTKDIYLLTEKLPKSEIYGLSSQMRRASVSIPSNIAEGFKRPGRADFRQFVSIALGSSAELETQLILVGEIYPETNTSQMVDQVVEIQKMLSVLHKNLNRP